MITKEIFIEELISFYPASVNYLAQKGIRCIVCGEPVWGTLEEACIEKGLSSGDIDLIVNEMNKLLI
jgi:methionine synthase II (cobalamin-independent)